LTMLGRRLRPEAPAGHQTGSRSGAAEARGRARSKGRFPILRRIWCCEKAASAILQAPIALMPADQAEDIARLDPRLLPGDVSLRAARTRSATRGSQWPIRRALRRSWLPLLDEHLE
jgi:hypothetical protein